MSHEVETMAWANELPWHGLGNKVDANVSCEAMIQAAGLDWKVNKLPLFTEIMGEKIPTDRYALVRDSDNKILTVTGKGWKPVQNVQVMEFFREYCEAGGMTLETAGSLRGGKIVWALAKVNRHFSLSGGRDVVNGYVLLVSPHEVGQSTSVRFTSVRVVCANTLAMAGGVGGKAEYRQSHTRDFNISAAKDHFQMVVDGLAKMALDAQALQGLAMSEFDTVRALAKHFQPAPKGELLTEDERVKKLVNEPELQTQKLQAVLWAVGKAPGATPGNGWGVLNGVTYWADHMAGRDRDARLFNSWLGDTQRIKAAVADDLLEMAND